MDQWQKLSDLEENLLVFQILTEDPYENLSSINSQEVIDPLNIWKVRMPSLHFCLWIWK